MVRAWHERGMANVNQTRPHCVNQMGKTHSNPLAAAHGRVTAWALHAMCESAFTCLCTVEEGGSSFLRNVAAHLARLSPAKEANDRHYRSENIK